jgi:hypothetical protein
MAGTRITPSQAIPLLKLFLTAVRPATPDECAQNNFEEHKIQEKKCGYKEVNKAVFEGRDGKPGYVPAFAEASEWKGLPLDSSDGGRLRVEFNRFRDWQVHFRFKIK